jgi:hypothetical protein
MGGDPVSRELEALGGRRRIKTLSKITDFSGEFNLVKLPRGTSPAILWGRVSRARKRLIRGQAPCALL